MVCNLEAIDRMILLMGPWVPGVPPRTQRGHAGIHFDMIIRDGHNACQDLRLTSAAPVSRLAIVLPMMPSACSGVSGVLSTETSKRREKSRGTFTCTGSFLTLQSNPHVCLRPLRFACATPADNVDPRREEALLVMNHWLQQVTHSIHCLAQHVGHG